MMHMLIVSVEVDIDFRAYVGYNDTDPAETLVKDNVQA